MTPLGVLLLALPLVLPQAGPQTSLVFTGAEQATFLTSVVNACALAEQLGAGPESRWRLTDQGRRVLVLALARLRASGALR